MPYTLRKIIYCLLTILHVLLRKIYLKWLIDVYTLLILRYIGNKLHSSDYPFSQDNTWYFMSRITETWIEFSRSRLSTIMVLLHKEIIWYTLIISNLHNLIAIILQVFQGIWLYALGFPLRLHWYALKGN